MDPGEILRIPDLSRFHQSQLFSNLAALPRIRPLRARHSTGDGGWQSPSNILGAEEKMGESRVKIH